MRDLYSNLRVVLALAPAVHGASASGLAVDLSGVERVLFCANTGDRVAGSMFLLSLEHSDNGADWSAVPAAAVRSDVPASLLSNASYRLGYTGSKRFARLALVKSSGTSIACGAVAAIWPNERPVA